MATFVERITKSHKRQYEEFVTTSSSAALGQIMWFAWMVFYVCVAFSIPFVGVPVICWYLWHINKQEKAKEEVEM